MSARTPSTNAIRTYRKLHDLIIVNIRSILTDPKGFGFKLLATSFACAFGGRKGLNRYESSSHLSKYKLRSIQHMIKDCSNGQSQLNVTPLCYLGHMILLYWAERKVRRLLIRRFGPLDKVVGGTENIVVEIGGENLWIKEKKAVHTRQKAKVIECISRKFPKSEDNFRDILGLLEVKA